MAHSSIVSGAVTSAVSSAVSSVASSAHADAHGAGALPAEPGPDLADEIGGVQGRGLHGRDLGVEVEPHAALLGQAIQRVDHGGESTGRVLHALHEVGVAHELVQRRGSLRASGEEHRGVREHLPQAYVLEPLRHMAGQARDQVLQQVAEGRQIPNSFEGRQGGERGVEEALHAEVVNPPGFLQVRRHLLPRTSFDRVEQFLDPLRFRLHVDRSIALGEDAVSGLEAAQVQLLVRGRSGEREEVIVSLRHEVPAGAGVPAEAGVVGVLEQPGATARFGVLLKDLNMVALIGEEGGGG